MRPSPCTPPYAPECLHGCAWRAWHTWYASPYKYVSEATHCARLPIRKGGTARRVARLVHAAPRRPPGFYRLSAVRPSHPSRAMAAVTSTTSPSSLELTSSTGDSAGQPAGAIRRPAMPAFARRLATAFAAALSSASEALSELGGTSGSEAKKSGGQDSSSASEPSAASPKLALASYGSCGDESEGS